MTKTFQPKFIQSKLPNTPTSIFSVMTQLANQHGAVNLSQGFPDFEVDPKLIDLVMQAMQNGHNQYAPMAGVSNLRECIAEKYKHYYNLSICPDNEITITAGGTQGLFTTIGALIEKGDEAIIFEPAYDSYKPSIESFGGIAVPIQLSAPDFVIDWQYVRTKITAKTKLIIINNPNNPTGRLLSAIDILELEEIVRDLGCYVLSDEVYEHLVYDGKMHISVLSSEILREKCFVAASFGKVLHTTGWKIGYVVAQTQLTREFRKLHQFNVFSVSTPMQYAVAAYLNDIQYYGNISKIFESKRNFLIESLENSRLKILPCEGTYFMLLDYADISSENEYDFAKKLTVNHQIATVPVSSFYSTEVNQCLLRLCFAKKEGTLSLAIDKLLRI